MPSPLPLPWPPPCQPQLSRPSQLMPGTEIRWRLRDERTQRWVFRCGPVTTEPLLRQRAHGMGTWELPPWVVVDVVPHIAVLTYMHVRLET